MRSQGLVCSPIKTLRELGSERRKTVRLFDISNKMTVAVYKFCHMLETPFLKRDVESLPT